MAKGMRSVRRNFRKEVLQCVNAGDGSIERLTELAGKFFGFQVGYELLIKSFLNSEVSNAVSQLRCQGEIETVGKQWKPVSSLNPDEMRGILLRTRKRIRGELESTVRRAHQFGFAEDAIDATKALSALAMVEEAIEARETEELSAAKS